jgi:hypothetical protein
LNISISERVQNGVNLLNDYAGDWFWMVNLDLLDITSPEECILGQLFGSFQNGTRDLGFSYDQYTQSLNGFEMTHGEYTSESVASIQAQIEDEWRILISALRAGKNSQ